jgi:phosphonate transport system ATP-binding protein
MQALERVDIVEKAYVRAANLSGGSSSEWASPEPWPRNPRSCSPTSRWPAWTRHQPRGHARLQRIGRELGITTIVNLHFLDLPRCGERIVGLRAGSSSTTARCPGRRARLRDIYGRSLTADDLMGEAPPAPASISA